MLVNLLAAAPYHHRVPSTFHFWLHWFATDWHWAILLGCLTLLLVFGVVGVVVEDNGDWWIF